jgi:subfamily B ATP-binding cassette protein MsbA
VFGLVSQDIFLFHDTVEENIKIGQEFSEEAFHQALVTAGADDFIKQLKQGPQTMIGDRGTRLSGGQGQRLTIARAVLQNPSVLLFDEATSALDSSSEKIVQEALERWSGGKTVLAVAHRLSTIQNYDKIIVMRKGSILESGKHAELMEIKGEYSRLYELGQKQLV